MHFVSTPKIEGCHGNLDDDGCRCDGTRAMELMAALAYSTGEYFRSVQTSVAQILQPVWITEADSVSLKPGPVAIATRS